VLLFIGAKIIKKSTSIENLPPKYSKKSSPPQNKKREAAMVATSLNVI